jgi:HEPN domain-containing protein
VPSSSTYSTKALKALHYFGGARFVPGHSLVELLAPLAVLDPSLAALAEAARRLDQLYIPTRYPNGLPGGVAAEVFSRGQAAEAIAQAATFLERAGATID